MCAGAVIDSAFITLSSRELDRSCGITRESHPAAPFIKPNTLTCERRKAAWTDPFIDL
jgi:hypothetical protein